MSSSSAADTPADDGIRIVAAIDFGTHGTGFAWAWTPTGPARMLTGAEINTRNQWQGAGGVAYPKNRTALLLDPSRTQVLAWGFEAVRRHQAEPPGPDAGRYLVNFKAALKAREGADVIVRGAVASPEQAREQVARYLGYVVAAALADMREKGPLSQDGREIRWCLTVPALWGDYEMQLMRQAAEDAGLPKDPDRLLLAVEPEAAVHHVRSLGGVGERLVAEGRRIMVVDAGGGTVDIIAYDVDQNREIHQVGGKLGDMVGCEYVTERFVQDVVLARLVPDGMEGAAAFGKVLLDKRALLGRLADAWDRAKGDVGRDLQHDLRFDLVRALYDLLPEKVRAHLREVQAGEDDVLVVSPDQARALFDPTVDAVLDLIERQIKLLAAEPRPGSGPAVDTVLLVGGFAKSPYLRERVTERLAGRAEVFVVPESDASVLKGAVHFCHKSIVRSRRAESSYGIRTIRPWRFLHDPVHRRRRTGFLLGVCDVVFTEMVPRGKDIPARFSFSRKFIPTSETVRDLQLEVYRTTESETKYIDQAGCRLIGTILVNLGPVMDGPLRLRGVVVTLEFGAVDIVTTARFEHSSVPIPNVLSFQPDPGR